MNARPLAVLVPLACALLLPRRALADAKGEACVKAFEAGQDHRRKGRDAEALKELEVCARPVCPDVLRIPCTTWKGEIENARPVLAFSITDEKGTPTTEGQVSVDGQPPVPPTTEVTVTVGPHTVRATRPDRSPQEVTVRVASGEKHRVSIAFAAPAIVRAGSDRTVYLKGSGPPVATYLLGAVSAVGLASFIGFGLGGRTEQKRLDDTCSPRCTDSDIATAKQRYLIADVSLGVSLVTAGAAAYFAFRKSPERAAAGAQVKVSAGPAGGFLGLARSF